MAWPQISSRSYAVRIAASEHEGADSDVEVERVAVEADGDGKVDDFVVAWVREASGAGL